ncbi:Fe-only nitrogenase accessory AnfO family protein [Pseudaeromonas sp. ZJS20]|uniref:Fe-only nitrogenase accessory AnfO family protein n=1 Tax=Pseudaeromonas aegiceratis TaxID=3153928 RepID=UPI00390C4D90
MQIAVFEDGAGASQSLPGAGQIRLYQAEGEAGPWQAGAAFPFALAQGDLAAMRHQVIQLLKRLHRHGCRDLAVREMHGFVRAILDGFGVGMWCLRGDIPTGLTAIRRQRLAQHAASASDDSQRQPGRCRGQGSGAPLSAEARARFLPQPTADGVAGSFVIDLVQSLAASGLNSQQLLLPFLQAQPFTRLQIRCDHPPRWLARELAARAIQLEMTVGADGLPRLWLTPKAPA